VHAKQIVPAVVEFVDIAGIVRGASTGEGLGNKFLGNIRSTNAIVHVVRCFEDGNVVHVDGSTDPIRDVETIETELGLADLETIEKRTVAARKAAKTGNKDAVATVAFLEALSAHVSGGAPARSFPVPDAQRSAYADCHLLTGKPVLYVANVDEASLADGNELSDALEAHAKSVGAGIVRICGRTEAELSELPDEEKREYLAELGVAEPGLNRLIREAYALLQYITFLTAGPKEVRAWTIRKGDRAPAAAGVIHSDFEKHFIRAEVIAFDTYVECGGEAGAKAKGAMRVEGKDYVVQDGDVMLFRTSA